MKRRDFLRTTFGGSLAAGGFLRSGPILAAETATLRVGYQKSSAGLILAKESGGLARRLAAHGFGLTWHEFAAGPPMLEALNVGSVDLAMTGDTPPIFAQAAGARLVYAGYEPAKPDSSAILVKADSPLKRLADLKGRRVAFHKGSSAHNLYLRALEKAGLSPDEVTPVYLAPADGRAAFERGSVDAWAIWDPYYAQTERAAAVRALTTARGLASNHTFYLASQAFAERHPVVLREVFEELDRNQQWRERAPDEVAAVLARYAGLDKAIFDVVLSRRPDFSVKPVPDAVLAEQQAIADLFHHHGILPQAIRVADLAWRAPA